MATISTLTHQKHVALDHIRETATEYAIGTLDNREMQRITRMYRGLIEPEEAQNVIRKARERVEYVDRMASKGIYL